jgi:hypothetical protein
LPVPAPGAATATSGPAGARSAPSAKADANVVATSSGEIGAAWGLRPRAGSARDGGGAPEAAPLNALNPGGGAAPGPPCSGTPHA